MGVLAYSNKSREVHWQGYVFEGGSAFDLFMADDVAKRLVDYEGTREFETYTRGLATTGFAGDSVNAILAAEVVEERSWAIGEALAEAWLARKHNIIWPWNMKRDLRNAAAILPGADLVGFSVTQNETRLILGEVKTSGDKKRPPQVMNGRSGMEHQLDNLTENLQLMHTLLKWLFFRCKGTSNEQHFKDAFTTFIESGNKSVNLFGVLVRDVDPHEQDFEARGVSLGKRVKHPATCTLIAIYIPCEIAALVSKVKGAFVP